MPYIQKEERGKWDETLSKIKELIKDIPEDKLEGELNYLISKLLKETYKPSYHNYNKAVGLLECIKQEFYRMQVSPYEDKKKEENGDI
ncbi:MAG: hypothetical protein IIA87_01570 [Nanoarchaeota archaeon]|nr:hypothetical protein [Nanoarchaeota archaeon]